MGIGESLILLAGTGCGDSGKGGAARLCRYAWKRTLERAFSLFCWRERGAGLREQWVQHGCAATPGSARFSVHSPSPWPSPRGRGDVCLGKSAILAIASEMELTSPLTPHYTGNFAFPESAPAERSRTQQHCVALYTTPGTHIFVCVPVEIGDPGAEERRESCVGGFAFRW